MAGSLPGLPLQTVFKAGGLIFVGDALTDVRGQIHGVIRAVTGIAAGNAVYGAGSRVGLPGGMRAASSRAVHCAELGF